MDGDILKPESKSLKSVATILCNKMGKMQGIIYSRNTVKIRFKIKYTK